MGSRGCVVLTHHIGVHRGGLGVEPGFLDKRSAEHLEEGVDVSQGREGERGVYDEAAGKAFSPDKSRILRWPSAGVMSTT